MKIGILFGGQSREREIAFAGGRTVFDNLDKKLFEPIPIFVDSLGNFILLDWQYIYKGTIRDFYPPTACIPETLRHYQLYIESLASQTVEQAIEKIGKKITPDEFSNYFDFAFLAMHGPYGEDGNIQGLLEWYNIPYSGCGILASSIGIDKSIQKQLLSSNGFNVPRSLVIDKARFQSKDDYKTQLDNIITQVGLPFVVKAPNQGSSIGISVVSNNDLSSFIASIDKAFFTEKINADQWMSYSKEEKHTFISQLIDIRSGIGLPLVNHDNKIISLPDQLEAYLDEQSVLQKTITLTSVNSEQIVLIEEFIEGREFSCIVIEDDQGNPIALPPTEILKGKELFDYRSKYLPGISRKLTPIAIEASSLNNIRMACQRLFKVIHCQVYARLDGFITAKGDIFLNDPNTTSGMLPSSFFFHQAAEIGLTPSQLITYIIHTSLKSRLKRGKMSSALSLQIYNLEQSIKADRSLADSRMPVAVIMGGYSSERHISVESGRNIFEKLSSSTKYRPIPIFLSGSDVKHELHQIPINVMLKDNADDILEKINDFKIHPVISDIRDELSSITTLYAGSLLEAPKKIDIEDLKTMVDFAFIALHGRPGEDGALQQQLAKYEIPFNGSDVASSQVTINKYKANKRLRQSGMLVANHHLMLKSAYLQNRQNELDFVNRNFTFPLIAKPADDGCSSAVKKIHAPEELEAFIDLMFRDEPDLNEALRLKLALKKNEEFPQKEHVLIEELITDQGADHFIEITGGMLTRFNEQNQIVYEVFEPSEALASGEVLSLEEKFLAGEGQNITPARFDKMKLRRDQIAEKVRSDLENAARILNVEGYCRIDAFVRIYPEKVETIIIEINSLPGMTPATCIFHQSAINGYTPYDFIDKIIDFGIERQQKKERNDYILK